jgi:hypothetical protein
VRSPARLVFVLLLIAAALVAVASGAPAKSAFGFFKTPSGKIVCQWATGGSPPASVECGVETGLKPPIPKSGAACKHLDYVGNRVSLSVTGHVELVPCAGDAGPFAAPANAVFLHYGKAWSAGGLTCTAATSGLTCRNRDGHGFFLSLRSWRTF